MPKLVQTIIGTNKEDVVNATILNKGQAPPRLLSSSYIVYQFLLKKSILFLKIYYKFLTVQKRKEDVISDTALHNEERTRLVSPSIYSIAEFIEKINPKDENFFKYIPNSFLSEEQKQAKANALAREAKKYGRSLTEEKPDNPPLNDEAPIGAENVDKHSQDELRAELEAKVSNVVNVLKINQKEKISSTVTPQQAFDDMRDLSVNSITENSEKVNTLDEKNSKQLNDEDPPIADNNEKHSQDELRAELEAKVANVVNNYRADPRALAEYVLFSSRFNNYSANNLRLIWAQYHYAQYVTSGNARKKES